MASHLLFLLLMPLLLVPPVFASFGSWVESFCGRYGHEFLVVVPQSFICDPVVGNSLFRLMDLSPLHEEALRFLSGLPGSNIDCAHNAEHQRVCEEVYLALHARYVMTAEGMASVKSLFERGRYGTCPRILCRGQHLLPLGQHDAFRRSRCITFCPRCREIYYPASRSLGRIDGAAFGTTFPHLLLLAHPHLQPPEPSPNLPANKYIPRVFGFPVCPKG